MKQKEIITVNVAVDIDGLDKLKSLSEKLSEQAFEISKTIEEINYLKLELKINQPKTVQSELDSSEVSSSTSKSLKRS
ncbi:hypothetical protein [Lactococcus raffinolactis]|uniref:hypothetical protein n=1 Tax=Pseudolactococcus raffinolactis TaxID=1366 RepID=UPI0039B07C8B